jgi:hypothetical protein
MEDLNVYEYITEKIKAAQKKGYGATCISKSECDFSGMENEIADSLHATGFVSHIDKDKICIVWDSGIN